MSGKERVVIIGAGVIGAAIAATLSESGRDVTLIDAKTPGGGTSDTSFGWVNANGKEPVDYFELNRLGMDAHRRWSHRDGDWLSTEGHVEIASTDDHRQSLLQRLTTLESRAYPADVLSRQEASALIPDIRIGDDATLIAHFPDERFAYPQLFIAATLTRARNAGANVIARNGVVGLDVHGAVVRVHLADGAVVEVDRVVSAAGRWTTAVALMAEVAIPMHAHTSQGDLTVGYLASTAPLPVDLHHLVTTSRLNLRPAGGGRLLLQALDLDESASGSSSPGATSDLAATFLRRLARLLDDGLDPALEKLVVGQRAIPLDGRTIAGVAPSAPWLYFVATHSGVTLAPYLGEAVRDELDGVEHPELAAFRPHRFAHATATTLVTPRRPGEQ